MAAVGIAIQPPSFSFGDVPVWLHNCTVVDVRGSASRRCIEARGGTRIKNCVAQLGPSPTVGDDYLGAGHADSNNNVSEDGTHPGSSGAIRTVAQASYQADYTGGRGTESYLIKGDSGLIGLGADLSGDADLPVNDDILGVARPTGAGVVDVGAHEFVPSVNRVPEHQVVVDPVSTSVRRTYDSRRKRVA